MIRCKFKCTEVKPALDWDPASPARIATFTAQWEPEIPEDVRFTKMTPGGDLRVQIDNPVALEELEVGRFYYLDLTLIAPPTEG